MQHYYYYGNEKFHPFRAVYYMKPNIVMCNEYSLVSQIFGLRD